MNSNQSPLISIVTVVYNGSKTLEQTIQSVINQSHTNIEYIIIDGGSTDGTIDIIQKYEKEISFWISEPDKGLYDAMNKGISYAKGELIGMINSDDWYEPNAVELIVKSYIENPSKRIFHGDRFDILEDGTRIVKRFHPSSFKFIYYGMTYNHPSMFVHKEVYKNELYNINLRALSDYEFVLKQYLREPNNFIYLPEAYVNYRLDGISGNMSILSALDEGFKARRFAGLNIFQNSFSASLRFLRVTIFKSL
ncbi:glycosyltransferase family 2 protein [Flavobacterium sp. KS-LB2]|uniref:glycosyltransferase family 2 protein n=1 Tax=Flavobacterium sp. KS-LB2 TaxID=3120525 RepID=UPI0030D4B72E